MMAARARALYRVAVGAATLAGIAVILVGFRRSIVLGVAALVAADAFLVVVGVWLRLALENVLALSRIGETLTEIAEHEAVIAVNTAENSRKITPGPAHR